METYTVTSLRSGAIFAPVMVMKPVIRGSFRPRARISPNSRWNSCATRAGRSWVAIVVLRNFEMGGPPRSWRPPHAPRSLRGSLFRLPLPSQRFLLRVGERAAVIAEPIAVALDGEAAVDHLDLPPVHRRHEAGHLVERLVHEGVVVAHRSHADDTPLPQVVLGHFRDGDVELGLHPVDG